MTKEELKNKIKQIIQGIYSPSPSDTEPERDEWDELTKFPELKEKLVSLLSDEYHKFITNLDWVSPKPSTFRINLKNNQSFYLIYGSRSWIAQVEGKKYYLTNLPEEQHASEAISRILRYGQKETPSEDNDGFNAFPEETPETPEEPTPETPETPEA